MQVKKITLILLLSVVILASVQSISANPLGTDVAAENYESELLKEAVMADSDIVPSEDHQVDTRCKKKKYKKRRWWWW